MGNLVGYAHLINAMGLKAIGVKEPALVQPVTRIERINGALSVLQAVAPEAEDYLAYSILRSNMRASTSPFWRRLCLALKVDCWSRP